jgi:formylglycine-generating enzyme required for sulfatase activity
MSDPPGARVSLNGRDQGRTGRRPLAISNLPAGEATLTATLGERSETRRVLVQAGVWGTVSFDFRDQAPPPLSPPAVETALGLTREERRQVQRALSKLGFPVGKADGLWGAKTRGGLRGWQGRAGRTASGYLDAEGYKALLAEADDMVPPPPPPPPSGCRRGLPAGSECRDRLADGGEGPALVIVPAGRFSMGSEDGNSDERPVHSVRITRPFAMGKHEVTNAEFVAFLNAEGRGPGGKPWLQTKDQDSDSHILLNGARFRVENGFARHPVIEVTWHGAQAYANWLSGQTGAGYRLPTEAEWEYAARAGTATKYWWGNESPVCRTGARNGAKFDDNASCDDTGTEPVGSYQANPFGLMDTVGNVLEWVFDVFDSEGYRKHAASDPVVKQGGSGRVLRGGSWSYAPRFLRAAIRYRYAPAGSYGSSGFRLARTL